MVPGGIPPCLSSSCTPKALGLWSDVLGLFFFHVRGEARGFVSRRLSSQSVTFPIVSLLLLREVAVRAVTRQPSGGLCDQFSRG